MGELLYLPNIGKDTERQLKEAGINTKDELKEIGAEQAWLKLQEIGVIGRSHWLYFPKTSLRKHVNSINR